MARSEVNVHFEHFHLVARILVQPDLADADHVRTFEKFRDERDDVAREFHVLGLFGIDAKPTEVWQAELRGALGFVFSQLAEVVVKPVRRTAIKARPECRLTNGGATSYNH